MRKSTFRRVRPAKFQFNLCIHAVWSGSSPDSFWIAITKTRLFKYSQNFTAKQWIFSDKNSDIFHISAPTQNIDCGYSIELPRRGGSNEYHNLCFSRGGSNEYPQSMFLSWNKKNNVYPGKPHFYYIKVGFKRVKIIQVCFRDARMPSFFIRTTKTLMRLCGCSGWFESSLGTHTRKYVFSYCC